MMRNLRGAIAMSSSSSSSGGRSASSVRRAQEDATTAVVLAAADDDGGEVEEEFDGRLRLRLRRCLRPHSSSPPHLAYHSGPRRRSRSLHVVTSQVAAKAGVTDLLAGRGTTALAEAAASGVERGGIGVSSRRGFARSSGPPASCETPEDKARTFVISLGHSPRIARGVVDALASSGLSGEMLLSTVRTMAGRIEVGEDAGLDALVASVEQELARSEGKKVVTFHCVPPSAWNSAEPDYDAKVGEGEDEFGECDESEEEVQRMMDASFEVRGYEGMSITDVAKFGTLENADVLGEHLECACSGIMACSTCHVVVSPRWFHRVGEPSEAEQDMIDLAYNPKRTSRLGCQVVLRKELDGLVVKLPRGANNMMDHIPFEDDQYC